MAGRPLTTAVMVALVLGGCTDDVVTGPLPVTVTKSPLGGPLPSEPEPTYAVTERIDLPTSGYQPDAPMKSLVKGTLVWKDSCFLLDTGDSSVLLIWPEGYYGHRAQGGDYQVLNRTGRVAATVGSTLRAFAGSDSSVRTGGCSTRAKRAWVELGDGSLGPTTITPTVARRVVEFARPA